MLLNNPEMLTSDPEIMAALVHDLAHSGETTDIRSKALEGMQSEVKRLTDKMDQVTSASYDTASAVSQIHRAIVHLSEAANREELVARIENDLAPILKIPHAKIEERQLRVLSMNGLTAELPLSDVAVLVLTGDSMDRFSPNLRKDLIQFFHSMLVFLWTNTNP